jgi:anion-transporting  ArsA/GET3 family ATPase
MASALEPLVDGRRIVICAGSGGVGKTTAAAALALAAAHRGRRACVVTIDPARRLADALGVGELTNEPHQVAGDWPGELWALMLDTKSTFDHVVAAYAATPEQAEVIYHNRFYRNISAALSGTQEYMAMEKLYELQAERRFDLIVVDTPPTRRALDFLEAPGRLTRLLDNRIFRLLMGPTRAGLKAINVATQVFLRTVSRVVGGEVVREAVNFFEAFEGMEQGFRERAQAVLALMSDPLTAWILVTTPRQDAIDEAMYFGRRLHESSIGIDAVVVNRVFPGYGPVPDVGRAGQLTDFAANLADLGRLAAREQAYIDELSDRVPEAPVVRVPHLDTDVHDLDGLVVIGGHLLGEGDPAPGLGRAAGRGAPPGAPAAVS